MSPNSWASATSSSLCAIATTTKMSAAAVEANIHNNVQNEDEIEADDVSGTTLRRPWRSGNRRCISVWPPGSLWLRRSCFVLGWLLACADCLPPSIAPPQVRLGMRTSADRCNRITFPTSLRRSGSYFRHLPAPTADTKPIWSFNRIADRLCDTDPMSPTSAAFPSQSAAMSTRTVAVIIPSGRAVMSFLMMR